MTNFVTFKILAGEIGIETDNKNFTVVNRLNGDSPIMRFVYDPKASRIWSRDIAFVSDDQYSSAINVECSFEQGKEIILNMMDFQLSREIDYSKSEKYIHFDIDILKFYSANNNNLPVYSIGDRLADVFDPAFLKLPLQTS